MRGRFFARTRDRWLRAPYLHIALALAVSLFCFALYRWQTNARERALLDREAGRMLLFALLFQKDLRSLSDNVVSLSDGDGLRGYIEKGDRVELARAVRRALFYSRQQPLYDQMRFIDESGMERLRVNRDGVLVPESELQNKSPQPYFRRTLALDRGQLYISIFDLNIEHGSVEIPYKPVLRFGTPVFDSEGRKRGIYVVNLLAGDALSVIRQMRADVGHRFRVLNSNGYWIKAGDPSAEWAFLFPEKKGKGLAQEDAALWSRVCSKTSGSAEYKGGLFTWTRLDLVTCGSVSLSRDQICADESFVVIGSEITADERALLARNDRLIFLALGFVLMGVSLAGARQYLARREANEALRRSEERLAVTLYSIGDAVIATDLEGAVTRMNRAAERLTQWPLDEAWGRPSGEVLKFVDEENQEPVDCGVSWALETGSGPRDQRPLALVARDGTQLSVLRSVARIQDKEQRQALGAVVVLRDVSEARRLERERAHFAERLETANKELESFSYSVSHDLRAPLRHIQGYVDLFSRETDGRLSEKELRYLRTISHSAKDMGTLIDDLLSFSRMGRAEIRETEVDPLELVEAVRRDLELSLQGRAIEWRVGSLPRVRADRAMLRQVFANLLDNAVKYTRGKPQALIEIDCIGDEHGSCVFRVRDNGAGFDMKYADKLFGVFQRLHRADEFEGTGIGLANVQRIVKRHGGRVWAEGTVGVGASIYFTLKPATAEEPTKQP